jgi:hypothetical protein
MTQLTSPFVDSKYGWNYGESGWNTGMDENLLKFSYLFDRNITSIVNSLPSAVNGQSYFLTTDNRLYFAINNTYYSSPTPKWFTFFIRSSGDTYQFNGTAAVQIPSASSVGSRLDTVELTLSTLGTAAFQNSTAFATPSQLDIVAGQSQTYTDSAVNLRVLKTDLSNTADPTKGAALVGNATRQVATIAVLRTQAGLFSGEQVLLKQYSTAAVSGGGGFWWDSASTQADNSGTIIAVTGVPTGRWKRIFTKHLEFNATDFGVVGNAFYRDAVNKVFWQDAAKTLAPTDDTAAMTALFAAAHTLTTSVPDKIWIDLNGRSCYITDNIVISKSYIGVKNGSIKQGTEAKDALQIGGSVAGVQLQYNTLDGVSLHKCHSTVGAGVLLNLLTNGVGNFIWNSYNNINEGGFNGFKMYGSCFMMDLNNIWINDTYSSAFYMPGGGGTTQPPVQLGGSTTTVMRRPYVTNVRTKDPAFDIGTGYDGITMVSPAADHITQFGRFKVNGLKIVGIGYSENIRKPIEGAALVDHKFLEIQNASGFSIDGFYASMAGDFGTSPTGIKAFLDADFIPGSIGMVRGGFPTDYSFVRTQGGNVEYFNLLPGITTNTELSNGRALLKFRSPLKFFGTYGGTGAVAIFTIPGLAAVSEAHTYLVTKTYSFAGKYVSNTWLVSAGNGKSVVTQLQAGPDEPTAFTLTVASTGVVTLNNTGPNNLSGPWTAVEFNVF